MYGILLSNDNTLYHNKTRRSSSNRRTVSGRTDACHKIDVEKGLYGVAAGALPVPGCCLFRRRNPGRQSAPGHPPNGHGWGVRATARLESLKDTFREATGGILPGCLQAGGKGYPDIRQPL